LWNSTKSFRKDLFIMHDTAHALRSLFPLQPKELQVKQGKDFLPAAFSTLTLGDRRDRTLLNSLSTGRTIQTRSAQDPWTLALHRKGTSPPICEPFQKKGAESFQILADPGGIAVSAGGEAGLRFAARTLNALLHQTGATLPPFECRDWPALPVRGCMVDIARQTEKLEYLFGLAERLANMRCNMLMLYFENKLAFSKHPLLHAPMAYSSDDMRRLARHCTSLGLELVPCFATLGHCENFLKTPAYRNLADGNRIYQVNPRNRDVRRMMQDMFEDWKGIHPKGRYVHTSLDEAPYMGHCRQTKDYIRRHGREGLIADYINWQHQTLSGLGYRMMVWGDMLRHYPDVLKSIPKDIMICEWNYDAIGERDVQALELYRTHGFETLAAPAASRSAQIHMPDRSQLQHNIPDFVRLAVEQQTAGVLCTQWEAFSRFNRLSEPGWLLSCRLSWEGKGFSSATKRQDSLARTFNASGPKLSHITDQLSPDLFLERFREMHFNPDIYEKTYHLPTHEMLPTHPLLYFRDGAGKWAQRLEKRFEAAHRETLATCRSESTPHRILRFAAASQLLQACKRTRMGEAGAAIHAAAEACQRHRIPEALELLQQAQAAADSLQELTRTVRAEARAVWCLERYAKDEAFEHLYGKRLRLLEQGAGSFLRALAKSEAVLRKDGRFTLPTWLAKRYILRARLHLKSSQEINVLALLVETSRDGREWKIDRRINAYQKPGSVYDYYWMPVGPLPRRLRIRTVQTRTVWTPTEFDLSIWQLRPAETGAPADGRVFTDEYDLTPAARAGYKCTRGNTDQAVYRLL